MTPTVLGLLAEAVWFVLLGLVLATTRPLWPQAARPDPAIPPGVQALLAHRARRGWTRVGVDATFADLARRGWLLTTTQEIRLGDGDGKTLNPAETEVLEHVRAVVARSPQAAAPLAAMQEGPGATDGWERFNTAYQEWAQEQGLTKDRFSDKVHTLLILTGGACGTWMIYHTAGLHNFWLIAIFFGFCIAHGVLVFQVDHPVLTAAGAAAAGPMATVATGPRLAGGRSNRSGWAYSEESGWRQWRVGGPAQVIEFSIWPGLLLIIAAAGWFASLITMLSNDAIAVGIALQASLFFYLALLGVYIGIRLRRKAFLNQREREFRKVNVAVTGQVVRKYEERHSGEDNTPHIEYFVVLDPGPGQPARRFQLDEQQYESVQEGQSVVSALPRWHSLEVDRFDVLPSQTGTFSVTVSPPATVPPTAAS